MKPLQSTDIPKLIAPVSLDLEVGDPLYIAKHENHVPYQVKGILLELLEGSELVDIAQHYPRAKWQSIVDKAVGLAKRMDDYNIFKFDIRAGNFILCNETIDGERRVVMIDFGFCRILGENESDFLWGCCKRMKNESGTYYARKNIANGSTDADSSMLISVIYASGIKRFTRINSV